MIRDYHTLRPFRFWCQKVLPLVYDDSLSYYELLCKVVDYLNKTREDLSYFITNWSSPIPVMDYNEFTDTNKIYLYMGDQTGYNKGHWYFYNPNTNMWEDGGEYGSYSADDELSTTSENAVQNKVITNALDAIAQKARFVAHRGYPRGSTWARDNSAMAIVEAFINGFSAVELDLRKDALGNIVLLHNATVDSLSNATGNISSLEYTDVLYKSEIGVNTGTNLTTLKEAIGIAKAYNGVMIFDLKDGVVSCSEVSDICESLNYKKYGFLGGASGSDFASLPDYVIKIWGEETFTHTAEELDGYLSYGTKNNYIRFLPNTINAGQVNLAQSKGFGVILNYTSTSLNGNTVNQELLAKCDFIVGDYIPTNAPNDKIKMSGSFSNDTSVEEFVDSLSANSVRMFQLLSTHPENNTGHNLVCTAVKISENFAVITGVTTELPYYEFKKTLFEGTWDDWAVPGNPRVVTNITEETYGITIKLCSCGSISTLDFYTENTLAGSTGWTTIYTLPEGYRPLTPQRAFFDDSSGYPIRTYIGTNGDVQIYAIPAGRQIGGQMTIIH